MLPYFRIVRLSAIAKFLSLCKDPCLQVSPIFGDVCKVLSCIVDYGNMVNSNYIVIVTYTD